MFNLFFMVKTNHLISIFCSKNTFLYSALSTYATLGLHNCRFTKHQKCFMGTVGLRDLLCKSKGWLHF